MTEQMIWGGRPVGPNGGLGAWRLCPCGDPTDEAPTPYAYVFHDGGDTRLLYLPDRDQVVAVRFDVPFYGPGRIADDLDGFLYPALDEFDAVATPGAG